MQPYNPSNLQAVTNWICIMLFLMVSLIFPFVIAVTYHERIPEKTIHIALGMYLLTVATTARNLAVFLILIVYATYMIGSYGAYKDTDYFSFGTEAFTVTGFVTFGATLTAAIEKWYHHVIKRERFLPFDRSRY